MLIAFIKFEKKKGRDSSTLRYAEISQKSRVWSRERDCFKYQCQVLWPPPETETTVDPDDEIETLMLVDRWLSRDSLFHRRK